MEPEQLEIAVAQTIDIITTVLPSNASDKRITWSSSNESVATVNDSGEVTGVSLGTAVITVTSVYNSNIKTDIEVTVGPALTVSGSILKGEQNPSIILSTTDDMFTSNSTNSGNWQITLFTDSGPVGLINIGVTGVEITLGEDNESVTITFNGAINSLGTLLIAPNGEVFTAGISSGVVFCDIIEVSKLEKNYYAAGDILTFTISGLEPNEEVNVYMPIFTGIGGWPWASDEPVISGMVEDTVGDPENPVTTRTFVGTTDSNGVLTISGTVQAELPNGVLHITLPDYGYTIDNAIELQDGQGIGVQVGDAPDTTAPVLEEVTLTTDENDNLVLTVKASDNAGLASLEVDHSLEGTLPEFTVGTDVATDETTGASSSFADGTWTLNFGPTVSAAIRANDTISFYFVITDVNGNKFGSMDPTTDANTKTFDVPAEAVAPVLGEVTLTKDENDNLVLTVNASDNAGLLSLEVDHSLEGTLPEFTVGTEAVTDETTGASSSFADGTWTLNFGPTVSAAIRVNDTISFYFVITDVNGNKFGSMDPTTDANTKTFDVPAYVVGEHGQAGLVFYDKGSYSDGWRYLEAAPVSTEWVDKVWALGFQHEIIDTSSEIGAGLSNTTKIVQELGDGDYAAKLCWELVHDGKDDWFLPSRFEAEAMYNNLYLHGLGEFSGSPNYWSSSSLLDEEKGDITQPEYYVWTWQPSDSEVNYINFKMSPSPVRAVRAF